MIRARRSESLLIIYTGGTIGMVVDSPSGALRPFEFDNIIEEIPELRRMGLQLSSYAFSPPLDSSNVDPQIWLKLVNLIEVNYSRFDGFVILHGTDTMSYTASALSFMLSNLRKPVILTGAQLPIGSVRTDAKENLVASIELAAAMEGNEPVIPEVAVFFQDRLFRGNRTTKHNVDEFKAFRSYNYPALAEVGVHIRFNYEAILKPENTGSLGVSRNIDTHVAVLKLYPGISKEVVSAVFGIEGLRGVVLELFGSGNAPNKPWFLDEIRKAIASNIIILGVTQCSQGTVEMSLYQTGTTLARLGVIGGHDITTEAAVTKLMVLLGKTSNRAEIIKNLNKSLRGEISIS